FIFCFRLVFLVFFLLSIQPWCRRRSPYLSTHPDEPLWLVWGSFFFPHAHSVVLARLPSPHPHMSLFSPAFPLLTSRRASLARLVLFFVFHTAIVSSPPAFPLHTSRRASLARLVLFLLFTRPLCRSCPPYLS